jgi:hypothetical protein
MTRLKTDAVPSTRSYSNAEVQYVTGLLTKHKKDDKVKNRRGV